MRVKNVLMCSASAIFALVASPLAAQTAVGTAPEETADVTPEAEESGEEIVVTGLRRSIESSQAIKRDSDQIVDAIVAEDIGKLPDITASASLARVTGVQVNRAAGEAAQVQVRGLPDISTTYNGREIFTAEGRFVAIQDFPAGSVSALEVFKSSTANLLEGGIGGQVNVRSRRPFEFDGFEVFGALNGIHTDQAQELDWNGNILVSNRWDTGIGEIGLLVNAAYTRIRFLDSTREQSLVAGVAQPDQTTQPEFRFPDAQAVFYGGGLRWRPSATATLQWKPTPELEIYADGLFQGFRSRDTNRFVFTPLFGPARFTNVILQEDGTRAQSLTASYDDPLAFRPDGFTGRIQAKTDTYQAAGGLVYNNDRLRASADLAYTDSTFRLRAANVDYAFATSPVRDVNFDIPSDYGGPAFSFRDFDASDPSNFLYRGLFQENLLAEGNDIQARGDIDYEADWGFLKRIQVGVRYADREAGRQRGALYVPGLQLGRTLSSLPLDVQLFKPGFRNDFSQPFRTFLQPTGRSIWENLDELRVIAGAPEGFPEFDPLETFTADEKSYTGYGQIKYEFDVGSMMVDGFVGVRAIKTESTLTGTRRNITVPVPGGPEEVTFDPVTRSDEYTDYLPNASARLALTDQLQMRLAYTQTRTRPNFIDLNPGGSIAPEPDICRTDPDSPDCIRNFVGGNPNLDPINSTNYDVSLEYYYSRSGSATVALFRRDVTGFISRSTNITEDPELGRLRSDIPFNGGEGRIQGVETSFTTFLDFEALPEWAKGFGLQTNYTYIDSESELPASLGDFLPPERPGRPRLQGVSKHAYNIIGFYEKPTFSLRLAYNYRSDYVLSYGREFDPGLPNPDGTFGGLGPTLPLIQEGRGVLDFAATVTPTPAVTIAFDVANVLGNPIKVNREYEVGNSFPRQRKISSGSTRLACGSASDAIATPVSP